MLDKASLRKILVLLVLLSVSALQLVAQTPDPIESIRQHYASINKNVALYRRVKKYLSGFSAEGGDLVAYFHGPTIMKIVATFLGETGKSVEEYYYWDGQFIFIFRRESRYDKPLSGKVVSTTENRFYFKDDKLIRWIDENGKQIALDKDEYKEKQNEYLKSSKQFSDGARSAKPTIEDTP